MVSVLRPLEGVLSALGLFVGRHTRPPVDMSIRKKALVRGYKNVEQVFGLWTTYPQGVDNFVRLCSEHLFASWPLTIASEHLFPRTNVRDRTPVRFQPLPLKLGDNANTRSRSNTRSIPGIVPRFGGEWRTPVRDRTPVRFAPLSPGLVGNGEHTFGRITNHETRFAYPPTPRTPVRRPARGDRAEANRGPKGARKPPA